MIKPTTAATGNISLAAQPVYFCAQTEVAFTPSTGVFDNTNPNRVCLEYSAGSCDFEWLETSSSDWVLKYQGAIVYSLQTPTSYPPSQNLKFLVQNGMVSFYSDDYIQYYFQVHMTQTFIARFLPAPQSGDPVGMIFDINSY